MTDEASPLTVEIDAMWCDVHGVYIRGWLHAGALPIESISVHSGDCMVEVTDRHCRADVLDAHPHIESKTCGFSAYLACPPFQPVVLQATTPIGPLRLGIDGAKHSKSFDRDLSDDEPFETFRAAMLETGATVVEIGARAVSPGASSRAGQFQPLCKYIGVDIHPAPGVDMVCDTHFLSRYIEPSSVQGVFSLAVLEHLAAPWLVAAEINRILKPGGLTYHVVPQTWPLHERPNDFWRMSDEALRVLFGPATGFEVVRAEMRTPVQILPPPWLREKPFDEFGSYPGMAGAFIISRKTAEIGQHDVRWPLDLSASADRARAYPVSVPRTNGSTTDAPGSVASAHTHMVERSGLFDAQWYTSRYPDVAASGMRPSEHYLRLGGFEGFDPGPAFDSAFYLRSNADVVKEGMNPLLHYVLHGKNEGRPPRASMARRRSDEDAELDRLAIAKHIGRLGRRPLLSVVMPVFDPIPADLSKAIESARQQSYPNWELCIADDCSTNPAVRTLLKAAAAMDERIKVVIRQQNGNISAATNTALELATGDFVCFLDHDDALHPDALYEVAVELDRFPDADLIYTDSDQITQEDEHYNHYHKTDWNYDLILGHNFVSQLAVYRRSKVIEVAGLRLGYEGSQDYDLALRVIDATEASRIRHIPAICYHWRRNGATESFSERAHQRCVDSARRAIADHLERRRLAGRVVASPYAPSFNRVIYDIPSPPPRVTVAVLLKADTGGSLARLGDLRDLPCRPSEMLVAVEPAFRHLAEEVIGANPDASWRILTLAEGRSPADQRNDCIAAAEGDVIVLLDGAVVFRDAECLRELLSHATRADVGLVAPLVVDESGLVCEAGIIPNARDDRPNVLIGHTGMFSILSLTREVAAVAGSCVAFRKADALAAGGFRSGISLRQADIEFAEALRRAGKRTIVTPFAVCVRLASRPSRYAHENDARGGDEDPFYNPNLTLDRMFGGIAFPSRRRHPAASDREEIFVRRSQAQRAEMILAGLKKTDRILEVGPSYSPLAPRAEGWNTTIVDHDDKAKLVAKYTGEPLVWTDRIEDVDVVVPSGSIADALPARELGSFDAIVSSHSIEHVPDIIGFLQDAARIVKPDGTLILAVPDKRYCFDYFRPPSMTPQALEARSERRSRHTRRTALEHWAYRVTNDGAGAWGQSATGMIDLAEQFDDVARRSRELDADGPYRDFHAWTFTPNSFELLLLELARLGESDWRIEHIRGDVGCEFHARLRLGGGADAQALDAAAFQARRLALLHGIVAEIAAQSGRLATGDDRVEDPSDETALPDPVGGAGATLEDVENCYRLLLGRRAESEEAIASRLGHDVQDVAAAFIQAQEFRDSIVKSVIALGTCASPHFEEPFHGGIPGWMNDRLGVAPIEDAEADGAWRHALLSVFARGTPYRITLEATYTGLAEPFLAALGKQAAPSAPVSWTRPGEPVDRSDIERLYRVFLGREPETPSTSDSRIGGDMGAVAGGFVASAEFQANVLEPTSSGHDWSGSRFRTRPDDDTRSWIERRFILSADAAAELRQAQSWPALLHALFGEGAARDRLVEEAPAEVVSRFLDGLTRPFARPAAPVGDFEMLDGIEASGWICNPSNPEAGAVVEFVVDGTVIHEAQASTFHHRAQAAGYSGEAAGFRTQLPLYAIGGADIRVHARLKGSRSSLEHSPRTTRKVVVLDRWRERRRRVAGPRLERMRRTLDRRLGNRLLTFVMPIRNTRAGWLREALESAAAQWCSRWEMICVDDGSTEPHVADILAEFAARDPRFRVVQDTRRRGVSAAVNAGFRRARGTYVAVVDHDDVLEPDAAYRLLRATETGAELIYSDEILTSEDSDVILDVFARPAFSWDYYVSHPYFVHLVCVRTELARDIGGWDETMSVSADVDFVLRVIERSERVAHVPSVLYRWRTHVDSLGHAERDNVMAATTSALNNHLRRTTSGATATPSSLFNHFEVTYSQRRGRILIVVLTKNRADLLRPCLDSIMSNISADEAHICVVDHESDDSETCSFLASIRDRCTVLPYAGPFNFSRMNNEALRCHISRAGSEPEFVFFVNNDIEIATAGAIARLRSLAARSDVGAVGATLLYPDDTVQHSGVILGLNGTADHWQKLNPVVAGGRRQTGYISTLVSTRDYSAVTGACLMIRTEIFRRVGGFDETFEVGFNDIDLCLRIGALGLKIICDPQPIIYHHESATRRHRQEMFHPQDDRRFQHRWAADIRHGDPFYSPLLSNRGAGGSVVRYAAPTSKIRVRRPLLPKPSADSTARGDPSTGTPARRLQPVS